MNRATPLVTVLALLLLLGISACSDDDGGNGGATGPTYAFGLDSVAVAGDGNADAVSAIHFLPDGRIMYAEQFKGTIRIILPDGSLQTAPFAQISVANYLDLDWGLTGLALDPDYEQNRHVYVFYSAPMNAEGTIARPTLVRFTEEDGIGVDETLISDDFPETATDHQGYNANGEIHFGPDGYLYVSVGDYDFAGNPDVSTDLSTPIGKLLRINKEDGSAAPGNPFAGQEGADARIYAYGFREPFPFTFGPDGTIYGTDNTTVSCEELNVIRPGEEYGWPHMGEFPFDNCDIGPGTQPIFHFAREGTQPTDFLSFVEVSSLRFLRNSAYPALSDSLLVCESHKSVVNDLVTRGVLRRLVMSGPESVEASDIIVDDCKGAVAVRDGEIYYATRTEIRKLVEGEPGGPTAPPPG